MFHSVTFLYLKAAWSRADEWEEGQDESEEENYRRHAIEHFERALAEEQLEGASPAVVSYLIGELYRRIDDTENAHRWFDRIPEAANADGENDWVVALANQQKTAPKEMME